MAHRGASGLAPENTISALELAIEYGADYAEIDVQLTRDEQVVLLHDMSLSRTTNGSGKIWKYDWVTVAKLDAGSWFHSKFSSEKIPTLKEVIDQIRNRLKLNIEIKLSSKQKNLADRVVQVLEEEEFVDDCMITSFDPKSIHRVLEIDPNMTTGLITHSGIPPNLEKGVFDVFVCHATIVDRDLISHIHRVGKKIIVWTVNQETKMKRFIKMGVDGIITDRPDRLQNVLNRL